MQPTENTPVMTVSALTLAIKQELEENFHSVWLEGEISNAKKHSSGHFYFALKDANAQISAVMFRTAFSRVPTTPKDGDRVLLRGEVTVYPPQGRYQIVVQEMRPLGIGDLLLKLEELKARLKSMGWFDEARKKPIPPMPQRIGVVTSPTGAAIQDILNILTRRLGGFHLILNPVRVQGETAAKEIAQAIDQFNRYKLADVLIVGRGGGSLEDLFAFNDIAVAEAIFRSEIPIISAVGHETDWTIADFVADLRAPTPSAAAELVTAERSQHLKHIADIDRRLTELIAYRIRLGRQRLSAVVSRKEIKSAYGLLGPLIQKVDHLQKRLADLKPSNKVRRAKEALVKLEGDLLRTVKTRLATKGAAFKSLVATLAALDPKNVLKKGYAIPFSEKTAAVVTSVDQLAIGDTYTLLMNDGSILSTVKSKL